MDVCEFTDPVPFEPTYPVAVYIAPSTPVAVTFPGLGKAAASNDIGGLMDVCEFTDPVPFEPTYPVAVYIAPSTPIAVTFPGLGKVVSVKLIGRLGCARNSGNGAAPAVTEVVLKGSVAAIVLTPGMP